MDLDQSEGIRVLHVEDELSFAELTAEFLETELEGGSVTIETNPKDGLARLDEVQFDCIVSDYNMPEMDGIEFLHIVREDWPDLPFILFTGRGSEEIASEAISAGVTDYLQKGSGSEQFTVLANRIQNAVGQYRAERKVEETRRWYRTILEHSSDYVMIVDEMSEVSYVSPAIERVMGYRPEEVIGTDSFEFIHPDDVEYAVDSLTETLQNPEQEVTVEFRSEHADGSWRWLETRGRNLLDDPVIEGIMVNVRDITERKKREQELRRETERFQNLTSFLSHDVRNQLAIVDGYLTLFEEQVEDDRLDTASEAVDRIEEMIEKIMELAQSGTFSSDPERIDLGSIAEACWHETVEDDVELRVESNINITADEERVRSLIENLFLNAVQHGDAETIRIGNLENESGFYVEDDGSGMSTDDIGKIFEPGYTTDEQGTGLGLAIVQEITESHGWDVNVTESDDGGVRFEFELASIT